MSTRDANFRATEWLTESWKSDYRLPLVFTQLQLQAFIIIIIPVVAPDGSVYSIPSTATQRDNGAGLEVGLNEIIMRNTKRVLRVSPLTSTRRQVVRFTVDTNFTSYRQRMSLNIYLSIDGFFNPCPVWPTNFARRLCLMVLLWFYWFPTNLTDVKGIWQSI